MSTTFISSLNFAGRQIVIYGGIFVFIVGILGGLLNTTVFLSLRTFRQSSCAFYLTIMSIMNIVQLLTTTLSRIISNVYNNDGTDASLFYCKFRFYLPVVCIIISLTCFCLATFDQYCATSSRLYLQQLCNIKLARRLVMIFSLIWILHGIPFLILFEHVSSPITGKITCTLTNNIYIQYRAYVIFLILFSGLPLLVGTIFGSMAYYNTQQLTFYTIPLVRRELDKQLTTMVLVQVAVSFFALLPYCIVYSLTLNTSLNSDPVVQAEIQLSSNITVVIYYLYFANPFYTYICTSERFRRQFIYVLSKIYWNRCKGRPGIVNNQVMPHI
ncbi:unnamed protein product [Adineta steineri]|uniref:G-protein coupled receptors family 1 profile domain-containing protein n=1 Tax=Adineta steineri TaxID=433720 RepID=A0A819YSX0_9BILA|nr:unnamed protein product [Adineta steineri]CAF4153838.1 unnamed protein product [Adineta steineri]